MLRGKGKVLGPVMAGMLVMLCFAGQARAAGEWVPVGPMLESRAFFGSVRLDDGRVLAVGGRSGPGSFVTRAEIYNPVSGRFTPTGSLATGREVNEVVKLNDGRVLVPGTATTPNEIFDPATGTFSPTGAMNVPRSNGSMSLLPDGRVLFAGGTGAGNTVLASAEIYDPVTNTWSVTGSMSNPRTLNSATRLNDGRILVAGGEPEAGATEVAEIYDPVAGTFTASGSFNTERTGAQNMITLADGRVMATGGAGGAVAVPKYELFNPLIGLFSGFYIRVPDADPTISELADGTVLSVGELTEIVDPDSQIVNQFPGPFTWSGHDAVTLIDGQVLVLGGPHPTAGTSVPSRAYLYYPNGLPKPIVGETANLKEVSGKVLYSCPGLDAFEPIPNRTQIRTGCEVDARRGTVELTTARGTGRSSRGAIGRTSAEVSGKKGFQRARFWQGVFKVSQAKKSGETTLALSERLRCGKARRSRSAATSSSAVISRSASRRLWGRGKGRFRTKGKRGSAAVRGTHWLVEDRCNGTTFFRVKRGVVVVADFVKKKRFRLKAGKTYVAGKKRRR